MTLKTLAGSTVEYNPDLARADLDRLVALLGGKPVNLWEVETPADPEPDVII